MFQFFTDILPRWMWYHDTTYSWWLDLSSSSSPENVVQLMYPNRPQSSARIHRGPRPTPVHADRSLGTPDLNRNHCFALFFCFMWIVNDWIVMIFGHIVPSIKYWVEIKRNWPVERRQLFFLITRHSWCSEAPPPRPVPWVRGVNVSLPTYQQCYRLLDWFARTTFPTAFFGLHLIRRIFQLFWLLFALAQVNTWILVRISACLSSEISASATGNGWIIEIWISTMPE